jgi:uncharacterized membrane protein
MELFAAYLASQIGCFFLALSQRKHYRRFLNPKNYSTHSRRIFLTIGYILQALSIYCCSLVDSIDIALTTYCGIITMSIFLIAMLISYLDSRKKHI